MQAIYEFIGPSHRFLQETFQHFVCDEIYEGEVGTRGNGEGCSVRFEKGSTSPIKILALRAGMTTTMRRTYGHVREGGAQFYIVWLIEKGSLNISSAKVAKTLAEHTIMVTNSSHPVFVQALVGETGEHHNKVALIPSHLLHPHVADHGELNAISFAADRGDGKIVARMIDLLFETGDLMDQQDGTAALQLLLRAVGRLAGTNAGPQSGRRSISEARLTQITSSIALNLTNPRLALPDIAHLCGISPRYLSRVLHKAGTSFAAILREERLAQARAWLADKGKATYTIGEIATIVGYSSGAQLSRCFHAHFACTPSAFRQKTRREASLSQRN